MSSHLIMSNSTVFQISEFSSYMLNYLESFLHFQRLTSSRDIVNKRIHVHTLHNYAPFSFFLWFVIKNYLQPIKTGWMDSISYLTVYYLTLCLLNIQNCSGKVLSKHEFEKAQSQWDQWVNRPFHFLWWSFVKKEEKESSNWGCFMVLVGRDRKL